jgi:hypothetical protein
MRIIRDVTVITGDVAAEGHDLVVDATTVKQIHANPEGLFSAKQAGELTHLQRDMPRAKTNPTATPA